MAKKTNVLPDRITIYTDGACIPNPGFGGYSAVVMYGEGRTIVRGGQAETTNNRMELMGPIMALESLVSTAPVTIFSDSKYVILGMTSWLKGWKATPAGITRLGLTRRAP